MGGPNENDAGQAGTEDAPKKGTKAALELELAEEKAKREAAERELEEKGQDVNPAKEAGDSVRDGAKYRRKVRCFVADQSAFNVRGLPFLACNSGTDLRPNVTTYYQTGKAHVMPLAHALDMVAAKRVQKAGIALLPEGSEADFTGIVKRRDETPPRFVDLQSKPAAYEDLGDIDVDALPVVDDEAWGED